MCKKNPPPNVTHLRTGKTSSSCSARSQKISRNRKKRLPICLLTLPPTTAVTLPHRHQPLQSTHTAPNPAKQNSAVSAVLLYMLSLRRITISYRVLVNIPRVVVMSMERRLHKSCSTRRFKLQLKTQSGYQQLYVRRTAKLQ